MARAKDGGDVAGLPTAIELGEDAPAVQLFGDALQLPPADPPGFDLSEGCLLGEVVHQQLADGGAGQLRGGQRAGAELGAAIGKGVEAIVAEGDVAGELALVELVAHDGAGPIADEVALILGDAGLDLKEQLVLRGAREGAAFTGEVGGDAQLPDLADGGDGVEGVPAEAVLLGSDEVLDVAELEADEESVAARPLVEPNAAGDVGVLRPVPVLTFDSLPRELRAADEIRSANTACVGRARVACRQGVRELDATPGSQSQLPRRNNVPH